MSTPYGSPRHWDHAGSDPQPGTEQNPFGYPLYGSSPGGPTPAGYGAQDLAYGYAEPPTPGPYARPYGVQQGPMGYPHALGPEFAIRKEPGLMLLASFFIPGLGTILNEEAGKGVGILIGYFVSVLFSVILIGLPFALGFWVWGMVDAYQGATRINRMNGFPG